MSRAAAGPAPVVRLGTVASTQAAAFDLAARGAADRTVVVADHQTAGRGRWGRTWQDAPGGSLLASIIVRSRLEPRSIPWLSYVAAVAVAEAIEATTGLAPRLKWPNDVLVDGRKIAGILLETRLAAPIARGGPGPANGSPAGTGVVTIGRAAAGRPLAGPAGVAAPVTIVGIGINLEPASVPPELAAHATCIRLASGRPLEREPLLLALLAAFEAWRERLEHGGFEPIRQRWLALTETIGRRVEIGEACGVAAGLDADGALLVDGEGGRRRVVAGEIGR